MAQQNIDYGSFPNDPSADAIRTAFQKIESDIAELYQYVSATGVYSITTGAGLTHDRTTGNVVITANIPTITVQTSNNLLVSVGGNANNIPAGSQRATISSYATPFTLNLANTITTGNANIGNVTVANSATAFSLRDIFKVNSMNNYCGNLYITKKR